MKKNVILTLICVSSLSFGLYGCGDFQDESSSPSLEQQNFELRSNANRSIQQGEFGYLEGYLNTFGETYGAIAGRGQLVRKADRTLRGSVSVAGLPANTFFGGHLHRTSCADGGGAHMQDPATCPLNEDGSNSCVATFPGNELFVSGTTDQNGRLVVESSADWWIPRRVPGQQASDLSYVIHDTPNNGGSGAGPKMLCVDLDFTRTTRGEISYLTENLTDDYQPGKIKLKKAKMFRSPNGTTKVDLSWSGLRPNFQYPSHVHASRCTEVSNGGPHYVRDVECVGSEGNSSVGCVATAETEFWSGGRSDRKGNMRVKNTIPHLARAGALSLVLHECLDADGNPANNGACASKPRLACVDFY